MKNFLNLHSKIIIATGALAVLAVIIFSFLNSDKSVDAETDASNNLTTLKVADYQSAVDTVYSSGEVISENQATIRSEASSPIEDFYIEIGDRVQTGDLLVAFRHDDLNAQLTQANAAVTRAKTALEAQQMGAKEEDKEKARLAVEQAKLGLTQATLNLNQIKLAQTSSENAVNEGIQQLYKTSLSTLDASEQTLVDSLATISDLQVDYFNCSSDQICYVIGKEKGTAIKTYFAKEGADKWNATSVRGINSGYAEKLANLKIAEAPDWILRSEILAAQIVTLKHIQASLTAIQEGFTQPVANQASASAQANTATTLATVNAKISVLESLQTSINEAEGFGLVGGEPKSIDDAKRQAYLAITTAETAVTNATVAVQMSEQTLAQIENGPRAIDLRPFEIGVIEAEANYANVTSQLRRVMVRAPFDGIISSLSGNVGELVPAGQPLVTIVEPNLIEIKAYVSDKDLGSFDLHSSVKINGKNDGVLTFISPSIDPQTRKVEVHIAVLDEASLLIGQYVDIEIGSTNKEKSKYYLPLESVKQSQLGSVVYRINSDNLMEEIPVVTGDVIGETIEITSGLNIGDELVVNARTAKAGNRVSK
ncbi:hypothetical protein COY25_03165 [Candidatus Uhrbacteria bacterium CG_4_10_14_0_2_um_filter_41_7]|uniref:Multidrug resistance protein MdtA-like C-terminal permuted SH3 domain-containing protein n=1 Tax=Candidatus Uhrbacteria bacterium CG_4_9_14_3_um_filter_41_35 TaxID=1975034 RepID=A0A2M7XFS5_9BACT|nr:MAG: hypothetical protein COV92_03980 [Candidatus Uhrbacteria bacterium CG11_big_fil_rev_8_21_14_0_20_41_9]PIZ53695.1 MAG: hypothetical protein COY25_03165 [Candidatus Uhrbacteria bacterium CG_4_10_14_0_2_um_filter_41_7]PJA46709.1 MAG: hypothetical protein CO173_03000 [Candidatus Uhrbacteria bacterium CG_4_9_14_3_um_filter_41_35]